MLTPSRSVSPFFTKLPLEIRRSVYVECLFVGEVVLYVKGTTNPSRPQVSLLRTCKALKLEAEPELYKNTIVLRKEKDIQQFFQNTLEKPARKLLPKSVEVSLERRDFTPEINCMAYNHGMTKASRTLRFSRPTNQYNREVHRFAKIKLRDVAWQRQVDPILNNLKLDKLVLDLGDSFCDNDDCNCRMAAMATLCFKKGFALQAPKVVEVKGWALDGLDISAVVGECLRMWTMRRAGHVAGDTDLALNTISGAEKWLVEVAREEEERSRWLG